MNCPNCQQPLNPGASFCGNCGQQLAPSPAPAASNQPYATAPVAAAPTPANMPYQQPVAPATPVPTPAAQAYNNQPVVSGVAPAAPVIQGAAPNVPAYAVPTSDPARNKVVTALVLGALGIVAGLFIPILGIVLGSVANGLAAKSSPTTSKGLKKTALVLANLALVTSVVSWTIASRLIASRNS